MVEPDDIEATAARLGLPVEQRQRSRPDGQTVRWRAVGITEAWERPWRCAYMAWDDPAMHPGAGPVAHPNGAAELGSLQVVAPDMEAARRWIGSEAAPGRVDLVSINSTDVDLLLKIPVAGGHIVIDASGQMRHR